jgi:glycerophosphoryl diester phosphodiesterase
MLRRLFRLLPLFALFFALIGTNFSGYADRLRWGKEPGQFYAVLDGAPVFGSRAVLGVAHNAGDSGPATALAILHGADIVEIDVVSYEGRLYAAHNPPPGWMPASAYKGPTLELAWKRSEGAKFVQFDLKETSDSTIRRVLHFLETHQDDRRVMISTRDVAALAAIKEQMPDIITMLSIGDFSALDRVLENPDLLDAINGVTIRASLLDEETVTWFQENGLLVIAWTVNDLKTTNRMLGFGVDGVTTDNLAVLDAIELSRGMLDHANWSPYFP